MNKTPIIIFSYNRPKSLEKLLISLTNCENIKNRKIYFYCDGPKNFQDLTKINLIKILINKYNLNFVKVNFHNHNLGLYDNIKLGCDYIFKKHYAAIILEDDLILHSKSLLYFDYFLKKFKYNKTIGSVSSFSYLDDPRKKLFFYKLIRHSSWGWATWRNRWNNFKNFKSESAYLNLKIKLNSIGQDFSLLAWANKNFLINSWSVDFNIFCLSNKLMSIQPSKSLVINCGENIFGTNYYNFFNFKRKKKFILRNFDLRNFTERIRLPLIHSDKINELIRKYHKKSIRLLVYKFLSFFKLTRNVS